MDNWVVFTVEGMAPLFEILENCRGVEQMEEHHPEGDVFTHSLQVLRWAFRETDDVDLILAALLHDVGKAVDGHKHDKVAEEMLRDYCSVKTLWLIEQHMRIWHYIKGEMQKLGKCIALAGHPWLPELVQLARWDKMGRNPNAKVQYDPQNIVDRLNEKAHRHFRGSNFKKNDTED